MKKMRFVVPASLAVTLGAVIASCMSFSSNSGGDNDASTGGGNGGTTGAGGDSSTGNGGDNGTTGGGGSSATTGGGGGSSATTGGGGSSATTGGGGGSTGKGGGGGSPTTGNGGAGGSSTTGTGGTTTAGMQPCDILAAAGNTCAAAHSTVRALYANYNGPLYQVCKGSSVAGPNSCPGGNVMDIGVVAAGGVANFMAQDTFCSGATCTISIIYDQSPNGNHLHPAPAGGAKGSPDTPASATGLKISLNGHTVYGVLINAGMGYRAGCAGCTVVTPKGTATGDQAETEYMVTSQNSKQPGNTEGCCFDYGNAETDSHDDGNGTMEAVYFGGGVVWGTGNPGGHTNGPWVMGDLENGLYAGWSSTTQDQNITSNTPLKLNYVTAVVVGDSCTGATGCAGAAATPHPNGRFAIYGGDATTGMVKTMYDGVRPAKTGYVPMHKQGSIILGTGGDNSSSGTGQWFEGVMASGAATVATVNALQANIVAAGYGK